MIESLKSGVLTIREKLWFKPLVASILSTAIVFLARTVDRYRIERFVPTVDRDSIETLLSLTAGSMLVIATFAVGSMVAAYASAGTNATPRSFPLVIADDVSQNALSTFIGAFIFSTIALVAMKNDYFGVAARFAVFALTVAILAIVIVTFVRWTDRIARLGRLGGTVDRVEEATAAALQRRRKTPTLGAHEARLVRTGGLAIESDRIGYVVRIDVAKLQKAAEKLDLDIAVVALPGAFIAPGRALAIVDAGSGDWGEIDRERLAQAFIINDDRRFEEDPRFGLVVLSEIAGRALSPAINDPGTAIDVIGTVVRLLAQWCAPLDANEADKLEHDRVTVPALSLQDMFDDAFTMTARDGAGSIEVVLRLQKAYQSLATIDHPEARTAAMNHSRLALARAELALALPEDVDAARRAAAAVGA